MGSGGRRAAVAHAILLASGAERPLVRAPTPAELTLLWAAASPQPDLALVAATVPSCDVAYVLEAAAHGRVAPLVLRALADAGVAVDRSSTWAAAQADAWRAHAHLAIPAAVAAALGPLEAAGIEPLLLKGLALCGRYPADGLRPMDDMDVLLPESLIKPAVSALTEAGWRRGRHLGADPGYDLAFRHPAAPGIPLELHYAFIEWGERARPLETDRLWSARRPTTLFGHPAFVLTPELELVALVAHAAKGFHAFNRLLWMADLAVLTQTSSLDWDEVRRLARAARRRVATAIALRLAVRLGADVPEDVLELPPLLVRAAAFDAVLDPARPFYPGAMPHGLRYALVDELAGKIRLVVGELRQPPPNKSRAQVVGDLAWVAAHSGPGLIRAMLPSRT